MEWKTTVPLIDSRRYDAVIFDMDGVVTDSAKLHAAAWTRLFDDFLAQRPPVPGEDLAPFTHADYLRHVDGKPRYDGIRDFLAARGITLPWGDPADGAAAGTVCALGNDKDRMFLEQLARQGVPAFESTVALIHQLRAAGVATAVFSASRNSAEVLRAAGVDGLFEVRVDGLVAETMGLAGKPDPAMLFEAARRCGADPARTVVVEDSAAGVRAGHTGGFGLVIGVDRGGHRELLAAAGADAIVADLAGVRVLGGFERMSRLPDALAHWDRIADELDAEKVGVLLDFDGTLAEIVADPAAATPVAGVVSALTDLAARCPVAIISGRDLADLRERITVPGVWYAGCHGFDVLAPDGTAHQPEAAPGAERALAAAAAELSARLAEVPGIRLEHKRFALAVHYRQVPAEQVDTVLAAVHEQGGRDGLRVTAGRKLVELRPDLDWDKGTALRWVLAQLTESVQPIYLGDDLTDEDAFDAVSADGVGIVVRHDEDGDRRTGAQFSLTGPAGARDLLERLHERLRDGGESAASAAWTLTYDGYDPDRERLREALCTVGNGYLATRGAAPESVAGQHHYPGTYVAGIYNRRYDRIGDRVADNESLVNLPNWLPLTFRIGDGDWWDLDATEILSYQQQFDLRRALLTRRIRVRDAAGRITRIDQRRFVSMSAPHLCALETTITAENWSDRLTLRSLIDGGVRNTLVARYAGLADRHLNPVIARAAGPATALLVMRTSQSGIAVAMAARAELYRHGESSGAAVEYIDTKPTVGHLHTVEMTAGDSVTHEKTVAVVTGRDPAVSAPDEDALRELDGAGRFADLLAAHTVAWEHLWDRMRIDLDDGEHALRVLRLHQLHLIQTVSPHSADLDVGVPARGLHGEAYRGHIFWDELFVFSLLNIRFPALTRALLRYRHRRLPEARRAAAAAGLRGAMFPWQSGNDGREESQRMHLNPLSGHWHPDPSWRAHHIGSAIAYNVWQYYQVTGDIEFLTSYGAELLVEIARFWASKAEYDPRGDRYHLRGVIGPDEFHSGYPDAPQDGIDDNAYTNVMAAWTIARARDALDRLAPRDRVRLLESLGVTAVERTRWEAVGSRLYVPFHDGVLSQFEGYDQLAELDWDHYHAEYDDIARLDRVLEAEGDDVNRYRAGKQADVLMLFYLLSADELRETLARLDYELPGEMIPRTIDYYLARTSHGSTLSALVHAWVLARAHRDEAMRYFERVLDSDVADLQGGTTEEGIHLGAMAGSVDLVQRCFTGLELRDDRLILDPCWPGELGAARLPLVYRGHRLTLRISTGEVEVASDPCAAAPVEIDCAGRTERLAPGETVRIPIPARRPDQERI
ncbi:trehalose-phosphatase [Nocardia inohanensis]|uniref:trehalose-phosphatase n=1 Tax=Nocardia inohanensis TaxID=209246 RepID=UPI002481055B|nr:trehalose-phosphatase [Nocardia inohanensis]